MIMGQHFHAAEVLLQTKIGTSSWWLLQHNWSMAFLC